MGLSVTDQLLTNLRAASDSWDEIDEFTEEEQIAELGYTPFDQAIFRVVRFRRKDYMVNTPIDKVLWSNPMGIEKSLLEMAEVAYQTMVTRKQDTKN